MKKFFSVFFYIFLAFLATGCGIVVDEGKVAVKKNLFTGQYQNSFVTSGWYFDPLSSFYEIEAREMIIPVTTEAKDIDGVSMPTINVEMRVKIKDYNKMIPALVSNLNIEAENKLGTSRLISDGKVALRQVADKMKAETMYSDNAAFALKLVEKYQKVLDATYPDLFYVTQVNVLAVNIPEFLQNKISSIAARTAEIERNNATISSLESRESLQNKEAGLIKKFMEHSGINAEQYVEMEKVKMIREIYEDINSNTGNGGKNGSSNSVPTLIVNMSK